MNFLGKSENLSVQSSRCSIVPQFGIAAVAAIVALQGAIGSPSEAEAAQRRFYKTKNGQVYLLPKSSSVSTLGSNVSLNPQPLPPKEMQSSLSRISLNPQPLPPKSLFLLRRPGFGR